MANNEIKIDFERFKGKIKEKWGKLTDNDIMLYEGKRDQFFAKLKEYYNLAEEEAEKNLKAIEDELKKTK